MCTENAWTLQVSCVCVLLLQYSDTCFKTLPNLEAANTGVSSVGHELQTGVECTFRVNYRIVHVHSKSECKKINCSIKSKPILIYNICMPAYLMALGFITSVKTIFIYIGPEFCAASPDECQVDRISVMNATGQCPNHSCATGYEGQLCNSTYKIKICCLILNLQKRVYLFTCRCE